MGHCPAGATTRQEHSPLWPLSPSSQPSRRSSLHSSSLVSIYGIITSFPDLGDMGKGLIWFVVSIVCTALFTGGWLLTLRALRGELKTRKRRKDRGLPKPRYGVTDDQARRWFEDHPGTLEITRENFPFSTRPFPGEPDYLPSHEKRA